MYLKSLWAYMTPIDRQIEMMKPMSAMKWRGSGCPPIISSWMKRSTESIEKPMMKRIHIELYFVARTRFRA